ncbi:MAG: hypothetical protein AB8I69_09745 [Anaerolineae bacterium]
MSNLLNAFQRRHQEKLDQLEHGEDEDALLDGLHMLISDLRDAGTAVVDPAERGQLRALARFWANVVYGHTGVYPDTALLPLDLANVRPSKEPEPRSWPPLIWILIGGAAAIVIAAGLVAIGWLSFRPRESVEALSIPAPTPVVQYAIVEVMTSSGIATEPFCLGTSDVTAEFTLKGVRPETEWYWELQRDGEVIDAQPAAAWGLEAERVSLVILAGGTQGIDPGRYDLLAYAGGRVVGVRSFQVLSAAPSITNLWVTDVPAMMGEDMSGKSAFDVGVKVIYLGYDYVGLCPGSRVSHKLYYQGELEQESVVVWSSDSQGWAQVGMQTPDGRSFFPGDYEIVMSIAGQEQGRIGFTVGDTAEQAVVVPRSPSFGDITVALGVQPDGAPISAQETPFGWATRVVHAVFDYEGMSDGVSWSVVWTRNGTEVAREDYVWDLGDAGSEGTYWVALAGEDGEPLGGGSYTVTLYVNDQKQSAADFKIYYRPE